MKELIKPDDLSDEIFENELASNCLIPMGLTSEILAKRFKLRRADLDKYACESQ